MILVTLITFFVIINKSRVNTSMYYKRSKCVSEVLGLLSVGVHALLAPWLESVRFGVEDSADVTFEHVGVGVHGERNVKLLACLQEHRVQCRELGGSHRGEHVVQGVIAKQKGAEEQTAGHFLPLPDSIQLTKPPVKFTSSKSVPIMVYIGMMVTSADVDDYIAEAS